MGQLAVAVVGGIVGSFFGMPQLGFLVGSLLGSFLFQPKGPSVGKVNDVKVTSSSYGEPIQEGFGVCRVGGNIVQASDLKQHKHSVGKGGGGAKQYTYTWTGAVAIAKGPIVDVTRIWADSKLVFDKTGTTLQKTLNQYKLKFRLYLGTEDQMPDAALEDMVGADNAVPYRGLAYIVFDNIPVEDYGNRVPNFTFEVVFDKKKSNLSVTPVVMQNSTDVTGKSTTDYVVDFDSLQVFTFASGTDATDGILVNNLLSGTVMKTGPYANFGVSLSTTVCPCKGYDGYIYARDSNLMNREPIYKIDPDGMVLVGTFGTAGSSLSFGTGGFPLSVMVPLQIAGRNFVFCSENGVVGTDVGVFCSDLMGIDPVAADTGAFTHAGHGGDAAGICPSLSSIGTAQGSVFYWSFPSSASTSSPLSSHATMWIATGRS